MSKRSDTITDIPSARLASANIALASHSTNTRDCVNKPRGTAATLIIATVSLFAALVLLDRLIPSFGITAVLASLAVWITIASVIWHLRRYHPFEHFGYANTVTTARALSTCVLAGFIPIAAELHSDSWLWTIAIAATLTLCLDGLDGYLARMKNSCSAFGARFDMEIDALLALVITVFLWQSGKTGYWILALGLMRYAFLGAAICFAFLRAELYPSMRRKVVCVIQVAALCLMLCPWFTQLQATAIGTTALACLSYSFASDVLWLFRTRHTSLAHQQEQTRQTSK